VDFDQKKSEAEKSLQVRPKRQWKTPKVILGLLEDTAVKGIPPVESSQHLAGTLS
jgi:hypothetical protein